MQHSTNIHPTHDRKRLCPFPLAVWLLIAAVILCGCTAQQPTATGDSYDKAENLYVVSRNHQWGVLDAQGKFVVEPQGYQLYIIRDILTHTPKYIQATKITPNGDKEDDVYWNNLYETALYDTDGKLVYDFSESYAYTVFGDYLAINENGIQRLINTKTGTTTELQSEQNIQPFNGMIMIYQWEEPGIKIYSPAMELIKELPEYHYSHIISNKEQDYLVVNDDLQGVLDKDFRLLLPCDYKWINRIDDRYIIAEQQDGGNAVIDLADGQTVFTSQPGEIIDYYDGNVAWISLGAAWNERQYQLVNLQNPEKNKTYSRLTVLPKANSVAVQENDKSLILDMQGNTLLELEGAKNTYVDATSAAFIVHYYGDPDHAPLAALYKQDGTKIDLAKHYESISLIFDEITGDDLPYLTAHYEDRQGNWRTDILDEKGTVLIENLRLDFADFETGGFSDGYRILARRGFYQGMMDMNGNWLYKESVFSSLDNEC